MNAAVDGAVAALASISGLGAGRLRRLFQHHTPDEALAAMNRGMAQLEAFEYLQASVEFEQAVNLAPNWWEAKVNLSVALLNLQGQEEHARAAKILEAVLAKDPKNVALSAAQAEMTAIAAALERDFKIAGPRLAVAGLNPHAGETGLFGDEEETIIRPAIDHLASRGVSVSGPHPPDTIFLAASQGRYDAVVAMYHDQGHIALKLLGMHRAFFGAMVLATCGMQIIHSRAVVHDIALPAGYLPLAVLYGVGYTSVVLVLAAFPFAMLDGTASRGITDRWWQPPELTRRRFHAVVTVLVFGAAVALGGLSYLLVASALRAPELQDMLQALRRRKRA